MDLTQRSIKQILLKYVLVSLSLWLLVGLVVFFVFWWEAAEFIQVPVLTMVAFTPILIPDKSAQMALNNQRILPSDKHLIGLSKYVVLTNIALYSIPFLLLIFLINRFEQDFPTALVIIMVVVNIAVFLTTFWKFRPQKTKLTKKVKVASSDVIRTDEEGRAISIDVENLPEFIIYPTKVAIMRMYDFVAACMVVFVFVGMVLGPLFGMELLLVVFFLAPTLAFVTFYCRINFYRFKRNPSPLEIEYGYQLPKAVFRRNLTYYLFFSGFTTLLLLTGIMDSDISPNRVFWLFIAAMWLFFTVSFLPLFISSHLYFKKLEQKALDSGRFVQESVFNSQRLRLRGKKHDESINAFLQEIGLYGMHYLVGFQANNISIDGQPAQTNSTIIAFDNNMVHLFSYPAGSTRVFYDLTFPVTAMTIVQTLANKNERRIEFLVGNSNRMLFILRIDAKGFALQSEMFERFVNNMKINTNPS